MIRTSRQRRSLKLATLGTVSIIGSLSTIVFYTGFAYLHDAGAEPMVQLCMLIATGVAGITAIIPLVLGVAEAS